MSFPGTHNSSAPHPYARSPRLLGDYRTIGAELLCYEGGTRGYGGRSFTAFTAFREGVAFVHVSVLESYLEDLLDLDITEETLFIRRTGFRPRSTHGAFIGLLGALALGLYAASGGASLPLSFGLTVALALPFAVMWHFAPRDGLARRVGFAQIISHEIARRRGGGDTRTTSPVALLETLVAHRNPSSARTISARVSSKGDRHSAFAPLFFGPGVAVGEGHNLRGSNIAAAVSADGSRHTSKVVILITFVSSRI